MSIAKKWNIKSCERACMAWFRSWAHPRINHSCHRNSIPITAKPLGVCRYLYVCVCGGGSRGSKAIKEGEWRKFWGRNMLNSWKLQSWQTGPSQTLHSFHPQGFSPELPSGKFLFYPYVSSSFNEYLISACNLSITVSWPGGTQQTESLSLWHLLNLESKGGGGSVNTELAWAAQRCAGLSGSLS